MRGLSFIVLFLAIPQISFAQKSVSEEIFFDCPVMVIPNANHLDEAECMQSASNFPTQPSWDAEIYFTGMVSSQLEKSFTPISLWGIHVGIPFGKHVQAGVSIDNPVMGDNIPSKLIQPARSSYSLDVDIQNFYRNDQSGIRIVFTHTSDHTVEELLEHANNSFFQRNSGGEINALGIEKEFNSQNSQTSFDIRWIDLGGHVNVSRIVEIPGYLLADLNSTGLMIRTKHKYKFGPEKKHAIESTLMGIKNLKHESPMVFPRTDYVFAGANLDLHLKKIHPDLYFTVSNIWAVPFSVRPVSEINGIQLKSAVSTRTYTQPQSMLRFGIEFDLK